MRRRGLTGKRELHEELQMKASELEKELEALQHRISDDRTDSGHWSKAPVKQDKEDDGDCIGRISSRGKSYDKYMEKRVTRLRTEQGLKRAAMNGAKLRALRDNLERCRMELRGMVVSPWDSELVARKRLQTFQSIQIIEEQGIDICPREEDDILSISRRYKPRKDSTVWNASSSSMARPIALPVPRPSNKSPRSNSLRQMSKPDSLPEFREENAKPCPVTCRKPNCSITEYSIWNRKASEDLQMSRSWLQKSSPSPLGCKNASERKTAKVFINGKKESQSFDERYSMSFESEPLIRKTNPRMLIHDPRSDTSSHNLSFKADDLADIAKVSLLATKFDKEESERYLCERFPRSVDLDLIHRKTCEDDFGNGHSMVAAEGLKDCVTDRTRDNNYGVNVVRPRSSHGSDDTGKFVSTDGDSSGSQSQVELWMNSASELHNSTLQKDFKVVGIGNLIGMTPKTQERTLSVGDAENLNGRTPKTQERTLAVGDAENLNGMTPKTQERNTAIGDVESLIADTPFNCPRSRSQTVILKGSIPFLIFHKRSRGEQSLADPVSTISSGGDEEEIFTKILVLEEQVRSLHFPAPASLERIKGKGVYSSGRLLKVVTVQRRRHVSPTTDSQRTNPQVAPVILNVP